MIKLGNQSIHTLSTQVRLTSILVVHCMARTVTNYDERMHALQVSSGTREWCSCHAEVCW